MVALSREVEEVLLYCLYVPSSPTPRGSRGCVWLLRGERAAPVCSELCFLRSSPGPCPVFGSEQAGSTCDLYSAARRGWRKRNHSLGLLGILLCTVETLITQLGRCSACFAFLENFALNWESFKILDLKHCFLNFSLTWIGVEPEMLYGNFKIIVWISCKICWQ